MLRHFELDSERAAQVDRVAAAEGLEAAEWVERELSRSLRRQQLKNFNGDEESERWLRSAQSTTTTIFEQLAAQDAADGKENL